MPHLRYLRYLLRHKWFVFVGCLRLGIPWLGLLHDLSKFRPSEWGPYVRYFYGPARHQGREATTTDDAAFDFAWLLHQKRNRHHWQFWVLPEDEGGVKVLAMPDKYQREMLADWRGAGRAVGRPDTPGWYRAHAGRMQLHPETRAWIEAQLGITEV